MTCTKHRRGGMYLINALEQRLTYRPHGRPRRTWRIGRNVVRAYASTRATCTRVRQIVKFAAKLAAGFRAGARSGRRSEERALAISGNDPRAREEDGIDEDSWAKRAAEIRTNSHIPREKALPLYGLSFVVHRRRNRGLTREGRRRYRDYKCRRNLD